MVVTAVTTRQHLNEILDASATGNVHAAQIANALKGKSVSAVKIRGEIFLPYSPSSFCLDSPLSKPNPKQ